MHATLWESGPLRLIPRFLVRLGPAGTAFIGSILLSLVAISGSISPNDDGMLYIEAAGLYQSQGLVVARQAFDWLFLPVLIATVSSVTGLGLETAGYLISILLLAGVCALLVACSRMQFPDTGWAACAVVLAMPAINAYRDHILREFGCWFFLFLAFWLALRWVRRPSWIGASVIQAAIGVSALFRPEALAFGAALVLWQLSVAREAGGVRRLAMITLVPVLSVLGLAVVFMSGALDLPLRLEGQIAALNPVLAAQSFNEMAGLMAAAAPHKYAASQAHLVLFLGMLSLIPLKFLSSLGIFVVPLVYGLFQRGRGAMLRQWVPWAWAWLAYLLVLVAFLFKHMFITSRYVSLLDMLVIPLAAAGLTLLFCVFPRWRRVLVLAIGIAMVAGVVSTSTRKTHYVEAAAWLVRQPVAEEKVYVEDAEIAYLAGWRFTRAGKGIATKDALTEALAQGRFELVLVRASVKEQGVEDWARINGLEVLERFYDGKGRGVLVLRPRSSGQATIEAVSQ